MCNGRAVVIGRGPFLAGKPPDAKAIVVRSSLFGTMYPLFIAKKSIRAQVPHHAPKELFCITL
jgi:hypothetical protein